LYSTVVGAVVPEIVSPCCVRVILGSPPCSQVPLTFTVAGGAEGLVPAVDEGAVGDEPGPQAAAARMRAGITVLRHIP